MDTSTEQIEHKTAPVNATGEMAIMGSEGDTKVFWDAKNTDEVNMARATFDNYLGKKYTAFAMTKGNKKGKQLKEFDPAAGKILFIPPMQGG